MTTTLKTLQAGSCRICYVCAIEGVPYLLTNGDTAAALTAWSGTDWTQALSGLSVDLLNEQKLDLHDPFTTCGNCKIRVLDTTGVDTFGKFVFKRGGGAETTITSTVDRNDTTINVRYGLGLDASGECYLGTECIGYSGRGASTITATARGKYSPFAAGGTGSPRFGNHHRVGFDANHVQLSPVVSQTPRVWVGKRYGIWLHTVSSDGTLNSKADAQLIYAGRIVGVSDDANTGETVFDGKHVLDEIRDCVIGKDLWSATIAEGMWLAAGRVFQLNDYKEGTGLRTATALTVVASGAAGANQIDEGFYSDSEICEKLNRWLASEYGAGRIWGTYQWQARVSTTDGLRTQLSWRIAHESTVRINFQLAVPGEVAAFLGLTNSEPGQESQLVAFNGGSGKYSGATHIRNGDAVPFSTVVFKPFGPGRLAQEFTEVINYDVENERGTFSDQRALLPASIRDNCPAGAEYGVFLLDEKALMVGSYDGAGRLKNCWVAPFQVASDKDAEAVPYIGRRADEPAEPIRVRQVFVVESTFETLINTLFFNSGTSGFNHALYDNLAYGLGCGIPGELLGQEFELAVSNLPGANMPLVMVIDEPTKLTKLIGSDLLLRRAFLRWKNERIEIAQWKTPMAGDATLTLAEQNKAAPAGSDENHRVASQESKDSQRPVVKFRYNREFSVRGGRYLNSVMIEDHVAVDDSGDDVDAFTLELPNTFPSFTNAGPAIEALIKDYAAVMPAVSRPDRRLIRSLDARYFEGYSIGDIAISEDNFARDPLTGARGIQERPCLVVGHSYDLETMHGEIEVAFLDLFRGRQYSPSAEVDASQANAGYDAGTFALTCYPHAYSNAAAVADASWFRAGDAITVVEIDPSDPAAALYWERTVGTVVGNVITPTVALSAPAWDSTKKYRIVPGKWSNTQAAQKDYAFQADDATEMVELLEVPYHYVVADETGDYSTLLGGKYRTYDAGNGSAEFLANIVIGDGRPEDVGSVRGLIGLFNNFIDYRAAQQSPMLWNTTVGDFPSNLAGWTAVWFGPVFLGTEMNSNGVSRPLTLAPFFRSNTGGTTGYVRATLSRIRPHGAPSVTASVGNSNGTRYNEQFSQAEWSTSSNTWAQLADATLQTSVKDLSMGYAFLTIELKGTGNLRGFSKFIKGARQVL